MCFGTVFFVLVVFSDVGIDYPYKTPAISQNQPLGNACGLCGLLHRYPGCDKCPVIFPANIHIVSDSRARSVGHPCYLHAHIGPLFFAIGILS